MKLFVPLQLDEGDKKEEDKKEADLKKAEEKGNPVTPKKHVKPPAGAKIMKTAEQSSADNATQQDSSKNQKHRKKRSGSKEDRGVIHFCLSVV